MAKNALPHTDLFTIVTAAGLSHQKVSLHRNIRIQDSSGYLPAEASGELMTIEISPHKPDKPALSGVLMGSFVEDPDYGVLSFHISKDKDNCSPYYLKMDIFHKTLINLNIGAPKANGKTTDFLALHRYLEKMKNLDYRRLTIVNGDGELLLTSSCPKMKSDFTSLEIEVVSKINELERKSGEVIGIPHHFPQLFLATLNKLIDTWEILTEEQRQKGLHNLIEHHGVVKFTVYNVVRKGEHEEALNVFFSEERGWINYNSLGFSPINGTERARWKRIAKEHGPFKLSIRSRLYTAEEFYSSLNNDRSDQMLLPYIMNLINSPVTELSNYKSQLTINFKSPVKYGWNNIQHVEIVIEDVDPSYNELESLLLSGDYVTAIPLLEGYKDEFLEDLAFAYALDGRFDDSLECANEAIKRDYRSVAHFTKGLAFVGKGDFNSAYASYLLAVHACTAKWHPVARGNLEEFIRNKHIQTNDVYDKIYQLLDHPRRPMEDNGKCYCRSGRKFKNCHGKA